MAEKARTRRTNNVPKSPDVTRWILVLYQDPHFSPPRLGSLVQSLLVEVRHEVEDLITEPAEKVEIDVGLESPGGDAHAAYKLAILLRAYARHLRVIVPDFAKSAATLLALAADEIYMAPAAELGPLDAQIPNEGGIITTISALDVARSLENLSQTALQMALSGGADVLSMTRLSRVESLSTTMNFMAKFMEPIMSQLDPRMIHWSNTLLNVSIEYAGRLLKMRVNEDGRSLAAPAIASNLVENYPTHGFVISRDEARELDLPVRDLIEYDLHKEAASLHRVFESGATNVVKILSPVDLLDETPDDLDETSDGGAS